MWISSHWRAPCTPDKQTKVPSHQHAHCFQQRWALVWHMPTLVHVIAAVTQSRCCVTDKILGLYLGLSCLVHQLMLGHLCPVSNQIWICWGVKCLHFYVRAALDMRRCILTSKQQVYLVLTGFKHSWDVRRTWAAASSSNTPTLWCGLGPDLLCCCGLKHCLLFILFAVSFRHSNDLHILTVNKYCLCEHYNVYFLTQFQLVVSTLC